MMMMIMIDIPVIRMARWHRNISTVPVDNFMSQSVLRTLPIANRYHAAGQYIGYSCNVKRIPAETDDRTVYAYKLSASSKHCGRY